MTGNTQSNAAKFSTVFSLPKEVIILGGYPPPTSSHPPHPSPPHGTVGLLTEVLGQVAQAHHVLNHLRNFLISLISGGVEIDVQIPKEDGGMPARAFVPGLLDHRQRAEVVWWDVAPHSKKTCAPRNQHECQHVWPLNSPALNHVRFVGLPKEGNLTSVCAWGVQCSDQIST
jgi:hypothetical protein